MSRLPKRTYLAAAAESPLLIVGLGAALVFGTAVAVTAGARAGMTRWFQFIAGSEDCCGCCWGGEWDGDHDDYNYGLDEDF